MISVTQNKVNLCSSCKHGYPSCPAKVADVLYGDGTGYDNICCCAYYKPKCDTEEAYQRGLHEGNDIGYNDGFEDGKAVNDKGCEGCKYSGTPQGDSPCFNCSNYYTNNWTAKDDKIEIGDEVNWLGDCFIVTRIFQPRNMKEQCDGIDDDGCVYHDVLIKDLEKTGRHFDIASILEAMKHD